MQRWSIVPLALALVIAGCTQLDPQPVPPVVTEERPVAGSQATSQADRAPLETSVSAMNNAAGDNDGRIEPILYRGTDRQVKMPTAQEPVHLVGKDVSLNFEEAPLGEVVHAILGDILGLDYIVDHPVQGKITLRSRTPIPRDEVLGVLESLLKANNVVMIKGSDGRYLVTGSQQATQLSPQVSNPKTPGAGYSTMIVPLQYISASNMAEILLPVASEEAFVRVDNTRNLLMLAGTRAQLNGWLEMVSTFDVDLLKGMSVGLFPLEHSSVNETADVLNGMLGGSGGKEGAASDFGKLVRIIPVKRLNSILVVTPRAHYLDSVQTWIERLDSAPDSRFEKRLYVYPVQNTTASRLAGLLTNIYTGQQGQARSQAAGSYGSQGGLAPGLTQETLGSSVTGGGISGTKNSSGLDSGGLKGLGGGFGEQMEAASQVTNVSGLAGDGEEESAVADVRVVADDENNALMIYATGKQYDLITDALEQLDVVATQVIIEASILEVTLTDDLKYGLEWTFNNSLGDGYDGVGTLANAGGAPAAIAQGFSYTVTNSLGNISAVLNALAEQSLINVISTPSVMVLDNNTAYIHVGDQVPVRSSRYANLGGNAESVVENIEYKDTGVKLTVRPSVNAGKLITMDIAQSVTDVGQVDIATGQRAFLERNIQSRVAVRSNESIVLGGLIRENASDAELGVPLLHRIPVLGALFGTTTLSNKRTELLVIITPRAIYDESELRDVSKEMRSHIRHMELIETPAVPVP